MVSPTLPLPQPNVPLFKDDGKPTQAGYEFLDRLQQVVKQINASLSALNYAPTNAQYVTMVAEAGLTVERILAVSAALSKTDGGAGNNVTLGRAALTGDVTAAADSNTVRVDKASEAFQFSGILTPAQITADQNDYSPTGIATATWLRLTSDAARNINGIAASTNTAGRILLCTNVNGAANSITFQNENAGSAAANRFNFTSGTNKVVAQNSTLGLIYDNSTQRWRNLTFV